MSKIRARLLVTTPRIAGNANALLVNSGIKKVIDLLDRNGVAWHACDSVHGSFSPNQEWLETEPLAVEVSWNDTRPVGWSDEDASSLVRLAFNGEVVVRLEEVAE